MAVHEPADPAQTMKDAADNSGSFGLTEKEEPPQEVMDWPILVVDPTEDEDESVAITTDNRVYEEEIDYLVHIASLRSRSNPRSTNDGYVDDFLDQLYADIDGTSEEGDYEKVRRTRTVQTIGNDEVYITTLVMRVARQSRHR